MTLSKYTQICDAIVVLIDPLVEAVIHDIDTNSIVYINGSLSQRKVGDQSLLDTKSLDNIDQITYPKINYDGKLIKSISVVLEEKWVLCINYDISVFNKMQDLSLAILQNGINKKPRSLFANDWQEKLHISINAYLQKNNLSFDHLNNQSKKELAKHLFELGAFNEKNAADYVAKILKLGRATVFKYLKEWRKK
ncbi:MAG: PAS domain-containing protein [Rickettsiales bacterium]|nr:PAS domain-containing protein [Rickettsiales bacterium]MCA0254841.1 PAS domain-containing protein [Pseudomonadota bacterium]